MSLIISTKQFLTQPHIVPRSSIHELLANARKTWISCCIFCSRCFPTPKSHHVKAPEHDGWKIFIQNLWHASWMKRDCPCDNMQWNIINGSTFSNVSLFHNVITIMKSGKGYFTHTKSRDHEIARAHKKVSKGRPSKPPKSCIVVTDPRSVVWSHMWPGPQPNAISINFYTCKSSHMIK